MKYRTLVPSSVQASGEELAWTTLRLPSGKAALWPDLKTAINETAELKLPRYMIAKVIVVKVND